MLYTELTALTTITTLLIISNVGFLCWVYFFVQRYQDYDDYGSSWSKESSWFFGSTPQILAFWILAMLYWQLSFKMKLVADNKPPSELNRSLRLLYWGGMLAITVLEIMESFFYVLLPEQNKAGAVIYYILVAVLAFCVGILFDSFRRITNVVKKYEGMSIDQKFMKANVFFCLLLLISCFGLAIPHKKK
jgi:hypothetical protein